MSPLDEEYRRAIDELEKYIRPQIEENSRQLDRALTGFSLPIRINEHDEYDERLSFELERYLQSIKNTPALMRVLGFLDAVQEIVKKILFALKAERRGDTGDALKSIKSILVKYMEDDFFVSDLDSSYAFRGSAPFDNFKYPNYDYTTQLKYPLSFFRCRRNMQIMSRKEMLHVPLTKRSLISSNRFSLPGIPCLYIASTTYCCWKELEEPSDMSIVALRVNECGKKLKILNLVITQNLINGVDCNPFQPMSELALKMRLFFPLVIATSVSTINRDKCGYNPEYTISHLIMRCLKELNIDGVAYLSTRIDYEFQYPHGVNVAIPIFSESTQQEYGEICCYFEITDPLFFESVKDKAITETLRTKSYINAAFADGVTSTIKYGGKCIPYSETTFSNIDNLMVGKSFYPAVEYRGI